MLLPNLPCWEAKRSTKVLTCFDTVRHVVVYFVCLWRNRRFNTTNKFIRKDTEKGGDTNDKCNTVYFYDANMKCSDLPDRRNSLLMGGRLVYEVSANNLIKWIRKQTFRTLNRKTEWKANWRAKKLSEQDLLRLVHVLMSTQFIKHETKKPLLTSAKGVTEWSSDVFHHIPTFNVSQ